MATATLPLGTALIFATLLKMAEGELNRIKCNVSDIAKALGVKNQSERILGSIRQDIERLLDVEIQINLNPDNPTKEKGYRGRFKLIQGILDSDDNVNLTINTRMERMYELSQ